MKDKYYCPKCDERHSYDEGFDSYYCAKCNEYLEPVCGDETCTFCALRPDKPLKRKKNETL